MMHWQDFDQLLQSLRFDETVAGGALVIFHQGERVVDTATGLALPDLPWDSQTLSVNFSIGKGVMATLVAILVSQGLLDYHQKLTHYWPAFGQNGKQDISLEEILSHQANLFDITTITTEAIDLLDWQDMLERIERMPVAYPSGQKDKQYASAYSALVSGWILGGLVEKVTGQDLQTALNTYLAEPLGLVGQLYYGLPDDKLNQIARPEAYFHLKMDAQMPRRKPVLKPDSPKTLETLASLEVASLWSSALEGRTLNTANINRLYFDTSQMNLINYKNALMPNAKEGLAYYQADVLRAKIPAANGVSTANALATIYAMHANQGVWQDKQLIDGATLTKMRAIVTDGFDAVMPANMHWRMGFHRVFSLQSTPSAYGHMGYNGSVAFCDPKRQLSFAFIHNFDTTMLNDVRQFALAEAALGLA